MNSLDTIAQQLVKIEERLSAIEQRLSPRGNTAATQLPNLADSVVPPLSPAEYVLKIKPTNDVERTLIFANFLETHRRFTSFTSDDISQIFLEARVKKPGNVSDKIAKNISKGFFMVAGEKDGKKSWKLTLSGQKHMEELENDK